MRSRCMHLLAEQRVGESLRGTSLPTFYVAGFAHDQDEALSRLCSLFMRGETHAAPRKVPGKTQTRGSLGTSARAAWTKAPPYSSNSFSTSRSSNSLLS